jgi:hypothetical protein
VLLDGGDFFGPSSGGWVGFSGGVAAFGFGEAFGEVLESLLEGGAEHIWVRVSPGMERTPPMTMRPS